MKSVEDLNQLYADRFDSLGHFPGTYHIVVDPNVRPTIHAPRRCPMQMKDEIKSELEKMEEARVIRRVTEPTDLASSLTFSRKGDGGLRMCLDPKDLNRAIKRCHLKIPTVEEITHQFAGSKFFSKLAPKISTGLWHWTMKAVC